MPHFHHDIRHLPVTPTCLIFLENGSYNINFQISGKKFGANFHFMCTLTHVAFANGVSYPLKSTSFINFIVEVPSKIFLKKTLNFIWRVYVIDFEYRKSLYNFKICNQAKCNEHILVFAPLCLVFTQYWNYVCMAALLPLMTVILRHTAHDESC